MVAAAPPPQAEEYKLSLTQEEQKLGADIIKKALAYPLRLIANNAGVNGSVVMQKVRLGGHAACTTCPMLLGCVVA